MNPDLEKQNLSSDKTDIDKADSADKNNNSLILEKQNEDRPLISPKKKSSKTIHVTQYKKIKSSKKSLSLEEIVNTNTSAEKIQEGNQDVIPESNLETIQVNQANSNKVKVNKNENFPVKYKSSKESVILNSVPNIITKEHSPRNIEKTEHPEKKLGLSFEKEKPVKPQIKIPDNQLNNIPNDSAISPEKSENKFNLPLTPKGGVNSNIINIKQETNENNINENNINENNPNENNLNKNNLNKNNINENHNASLNKIESKSLSKNTSPKVHLSSNKSNRISSTKEPEEEKCITNELDQSHKSHKSHKSNKSEKLEEEYNPLSSFRDRRKILHKPNEKSINPLNQDKPIKNSPINLDKESYNYRLSEKEFNNEFNFSTDKQQDFNNNEQA